MKRNYTPPTTQIMHISIESYILRMSGDGSMTTDSNQSVETELVKDNPFSYNIWEDDWSSK